MEKIRQDLITIAASPATSLFQVQAGLDAIKNGKAQEQISGYLNEMEARKFAGNLSRSTLWNWRRQGLKSKKVNGRRLFDPDDLRKFITQEAKNEK